MGTKGACTAGLSVSIPGADTYVGADADAPLAATQMPSNIASAASPNSHRIRLFIIVNILVLSSVSIGGGESACPSQHHHVHISLLKVYDFGVQIFIKIM